MRYGWHIVLLSLGLIFFANSDSSAQEAEDSGTQAVNSLNDTGTSLVAKIRSAVNGDEAASNELMNEYLVPAALALILLIVGYMFASFLGRVVGGMVTRRIDKTVGRFSGKIVTNGLLLLVLLGALGYFGVDVTSFAAILAAAGFAIGMALQGTLSNFAAGIMLLVFRPFKIDDYIKISDTEGTVEEIDLFTTKLNTTDNRHVIIPNGNIFGAVMVNFTRNSSRRVEVNVGVAYNADIRQTRRVLEDAIAEISGSLQTPEPQVCLVELGDSAVNWQCRVWCAPTVFFAVRERTTESVKYALDEAGIGIPYPQLDIHVAGKVLAKAA